MAVTYSPRDVVTAGADAFSLLSRQGDWLFFRGPPDAMLRVAGDADPGPLSDDQQARWRSLRMPAPATPLARVLVGDQPPLWSVRGQEDAIVDVVRATVLAGRAPTGDPPLGFDEVPPSPVRKLKLLWRTWAFPGQQPGEAQRARTPWWKVVPAPDFFLSARHRALERLHVAFIELVEIEGMAVLRSSPSEVHDAFAGGLDSWLKSARALAIDFDPEWLEGVWEDKVIASYATSWLTCIRAIEAVEAMPGIKRAAKQSYRKVDGVIYRGR